MDVLSESGESHRRCLPSDLPAPTPASTDTSTADDTDDDSLSAAAPLTLDDDGDIPLTPPGPASGSAAATASRAEAAEKQQHRWRRRRRVLLAAGGVLAALVLVCCVARSTAARRAVTAALQYIQHDAPPALGALLFVALDVACIVLMLPGTPLNLAAGLIFGFARGAAVSVAGITLGAVAGFLLGRTVLRRWAERRARESPTVRAALDAVGESAFPMVFLLRLSPVMPFPLLSYVLGATPTLSFTTYTAATFLGLLPSLFSLSIPFPFSRPSCALTCVVVMVGVGCNSDHGILLRRQVPRQPQRRLVAQPRAEALGHACHPGAQHRRPRPRRRRHQHRRHRPLCCPLFVALLSLSSAIASLELTCAHHSLFPAQTQNACLLLSGNASSRPHQSVLSDWLSLCTHIWTMNLMNLDSLFFTVKKGERRRERVCVGGKGKE